MLNSGLSDYFYLGFGCGPKGENALTGACPCPHTPKCETELLGSLAEVALAVAELSVPVAPATTPQQQH